MKLRSFAPALLALISLAGCSITPTASADLSFEAMRLNMLVGRWSATTEHLASDTGTATPTEVMVDAQWELGGTVVGARSAHRWTGDGGSPMALETYAYYSWDQVAEKYRTWSFDSAGRFGEGTMTFDEPTNTWYVEETVTNPSTSIRSRGTGTMQYLSDDEKLIEWRSSPERGGGGFRVRGRSERVSG
jgi:hypothetical protein